MDAAERLAMIHARLQCPAIAASKPRGVFAVANPDQGYTDSPKDHKRGLGVLLRDNWGAMERPAGLRHDLGAVGCGCSVGQLSHARCVNREEAEKAHDDMERDAEQYKQRHHDTEMALWGAILTLNGLIISASSVMTAMMEGFWRLGFLFSITVSLYSSILIFRNFNRRRYLYGYLKMVPSVETILDDAQFAKYLEACRKVKQYTEQHEKDNKRDENYAVAGLALSTLGCLATVYFKFMFL